MSPASRHISRSCQYTVAAYSSSKPARLPWMTVSTDGPAYQLDLPAVFATLVPRF